jgi:hypothetical protein
MTPTTEHHADVHLDTDRNVAGARITIRCATG